MRRADRLFQIIQYLRGGRLVTAQTLSERLEVSKRTIYRDISDLMASGVPIEGEAGVGYAMRLGYEMPPLMFTQSEIVALTAGIRLISAWGGEEISLAAKEALVKIQSVIPENEQQKIANVRIYAHSLADINLQTRKFLDQIQKAEEEHLQLKIIYQDANEAKTERKIEPVALWFWGKVWTLIAWCTLRNDYRMFRVDRIESIENLVNFRPTARHSIQRFLQAEICQTEPYQS